MSTHSLRDLRASLGGIVREVSHTGEEVLITDHGTEIAALISMDDYERLHEHADVADALRLQQERRLDFSTLTMTEMLQRLGVSDLAA